MSFIGNGAPANGKAHVIEMSNRATIQKLSAETLSGLTGRLDNHESGLNINAHQISNIAGLQTELNGKEPAFNKNTGFNKNFGNTAGTVCQGNDSRLSDARVPLGHAHAIADVTNLQTELDNRVVEGADIFVNTTGLPSMTADHRIQVDGYVGHKLGWRDLVAPFTNSSAGVAAPVLQTLANGVRLYRFSAGDSMHVSYHVNHDYAEGTKAYHHVHWFPETIMTAGQTVTWRIFYIVAKGHNQGDSLTITRNSFDVVYTSPIGGTVAGDHIVSESSDAQAYLLKEPDTIVLAEIQLLSKTFPGNVYGIQADLHYQSDREVTVNKKPNFNI